MTMEYTLRVTSPQAEALQCLIENALAGSLEPLTRIDLTDVLPRVAEITGIAPAIATLAQALI